MTIKVKLDSETHGGLTGEEIQEAVKLLRVIRARAGANFSRILPLLCSGDGGVQISE